MPTATILPAATVSLVGFTVTGGGGTAHGATSDASDASYIVSPAGPTSLCYAELGFATSQLPSGYRVKNITPRARAQWVTGGNSGPVVQGFIKTGAGLYFPPEILAAFPDASIHTNTLSAHAFKPDGTAWLQTDIDTIRLVATIRALDASEFNYGNVWRIMELYLDVLYATPPVVSAVTLPTAPIPSNPTITWTHTPGTDGGNQTHYQIRVYSNPASAALTSPNDFDPLDTNVASLLYWDSGVVVSSNASGQIGKLVDLSAGNYWVSVRTAQSINGIPHFSAWQSVLWTAVNGLVPSKPTISAAADNANGRVALTCVNGMNHLSQQAAGAGDLTTLGWTGQLTNVTVTDDATQSSTVDGSDTRSFKMVATGSGNMSIGSHAGVLALPVQPNQTYYAGAQFRANSTGRTCVVAIQWWTAAGAAISTATAGSSADTNGGFARVGGSAVAPATAAYASILITVQSAGAGESHWVDAAYLQAIDPGATTGWGRGGFLFGNRLTQNQAFIETDATGWLADRNCTIARNATVNEQPASGSAALSLTATVNTSYMRAITATPVPVVAGLAYTAVASYRAAASARYCRTGIAWYDSTDTLLTTSGGGNTGTQDSVGSWAARAAGNAWSVTATAPTGAVYARVFVDVLAPAASEVHYVDSVAFMLGTGIGYWSGEQIGDPRAIVEYSDDGGTTWLRLRNNAKQYLGPNPFFTLYDYEVPSGTTRTYRLATVGHDQAGARAWRSAWSSTSAATLALTGWWLKDPKNPALNIAAVPVIGSSTSIDEHAGVYNPLGSTRPVVVADTITGEDGQLTIVTRDTATWAAVKALLTDQAALLLQTPFGQQWYIRLVGQRSYKLTGTPTVPRREITVSYVEVAMP